MLDFAIITKAPKQKLKGDHVSLVAQSTSPKSTASAVRFDYFDLSYQDAEVRMYSSVVNCPFLKRDIKLAYTQYLDTTGLPTQYKLYFSTDLSLSAWMMVKYYRLRHQREFLTARAAPSGC